MAVKQLFSNTTLEDFEIGESLGKGGFAEVYQARRKNSSQIVALKVIEIKVLNDKGLGKRLFKEVEIHKELKHPSIVQMHECFKDDKCIYIVMEYCENGDLRKYLKKCKRLSENDAAEFLEQIVDGVLYLHSREVNVIHRDLSPSNVFLDKWNKVKIGDFGLTTQDNKNHKTLCGTPDVMAPEVANKMAYDSKADVWSVGCLLYFMLTGESPFGYEKLVSETIKRIISSQLHHIPDYISNEAQNLIRKLLVNNATERLKLSQIRYEPFMLKYRKKSTTYASSADSGRGTFTTNNSAFSNDDKYYRSKSSDRKPSRNGLPCAPFRAMRSESAPRMPQPLNPIVPVIDSRYFSENRHSSRSCERSTNNNNIVSCNKEQSQHCCSHSRCNENNVCRKCHQSIIPKNSCHSGTNANFKEPSFACNKSANCNDFVKPTSLVSCEKCQSYRENGVCGGRCKIKLKHCSPTPIICNDNEEPCCSKDSYARGRTLSPKAASLSLVFDQQGRTLKDKLASSGLGPIDTTRLKPISQASSDFTFHLLINGRLIVDLKSSNKVVGISGDGLKIVVSRKKCNDENSPPGCDPPLIDWLSCDHFSFDTLPTNYWKYYQVAANFVNLLRGKTLKIKFSTSVVSYCLMENGNFEARFKNGKIAKKKKLNSDWSNIQCDTGTELSAEEISYVDAGLRIVCSIELTLEQLQTHKLVKYCFPAAIDVSRATCKVTDCVEKENSRIHVPSVRSLSRAPLVESTNLPTNSEGVHKSKSVYIAKYKCHLTRRSEEDVEIAYDTGDKLRLFGSDFQRLSYISSSGKSDSYNSKKDPLPPIIQEKLVHFQHMLKHISQSNKTCNR